MQKIKVISEPTIEKPFLVIYKPQGIPSAPLLQDDKISALSQALDIFPEIKNVSGRKQIEYGLLHRIDTQTEGLLLIAASQFFYDDLILQQTAGKFIKTYRAECISTLNDKAEKTGFPPIDKEIHKELERGKSVKISSYFRNYGEGFKAVRPVTENSGKAALKKIGKQKEYSTEIKLVSKNEFSYTFECKISSGYRHQVRCHLAWLDFPIIGDKIYNFPETDTEKAEKMRFKATGLQFTNPITLKKEEITLQNYPEGDLNP